MPVLIPEDYSHARSLISRQPNLVYCICYVTARFVPGYEELRNTLTSAVSRFLQTVFNTKKDDGEGDLANMQALIILYVFARGSLLETSAHSPFGTEISYWPIKATCEAFAMHINLHRAVDFVKQREKTGNPLERRDLWTRKYLYWLWIYNSSQQYVLY